MPRGPPWRRRSAARWAGASTAAGRPDRMVGWFERFGTRSCCWCRSEDTEGPPSSAPAVFPADPKNTGRAAVVLHVSSPGGSALASDLIWREVGRLAEDKPVLASFSDIAASGGYYLAAGVKEIFARPTTLTGSIGVVGGKMVVSGTLQKLGVTTQSVAMGPHATMMSPAERFTPSQRVRFRASLKRIYDGFVQRVADGRGCTPAEIEPVCRGRVWTEKTRWSGTWWTSSVICPTLCSALPHLAVSHPRRGSTWWRTGLPHGGWRCVRSWGPG